MERSDTKIRHSSFDIIHSKGGFFGAWNLEIVCYLLFGAWDFFYSKTPLFLDMLFNFFNVFLGHYTMLTAIKMGKLHRKSPTSLGSGAQ